MGEGFDWMLKCVMLVMTEEVEGGVVECSAQGFPHYLFLYRERCRRGSVRREGTRERGR